VARRSSRQAVINGAIETVAASRRERRQSDAVSKSRLFQNDDALGSVQYGVEHNPRSSSASRAAGNRCHSKPPRPALSGCEDPQLAFQAGAHFAQIGCAKLSDSSVALPIHLLQADEKFLGMRPGFQLRPRDLRYVMLSQASAEMAEIFL